MDATTIAVDLAKDVFEIAAADRAGRLVQRLRLTRRRFERYLETLSPGTEVVMEACGTAHFWGRRCRALQLAPTLLPVQYVRAYVHRNKSDRADAAAILEARRCAAIQPVPVKTAAQQVLQGLHRVRQQWHKTRTARINAVRGLLREQGIPVALGAATLLRRVGALLVELDGQVPSRLVHLVQGLLAEIRGLEQRIQDLDAELAGALAEDPVAARLLSIPGVGVITASALLGSVPHIHQFHRGRQFASWLGLTPREAASGHRLWRGQISKRGDVYLRTLLIHGARSVLTQALTRARVGRVPLTSVQRWVVALAVRRGFNKATVALANRLARVIWAVWRTDQPYRVAA
ncbi:MAG TPA: IS110 family transposase [Gemmatimonadaceae bacterium]